MDRTLGYELSDVDSTSARGTKFRYSLIRQIVEGYSPRLKTLKPVSLLDHIQQTLTVNKLTYNQSKRFKSS